MKYKLIILFLLNLVFVSCGQDTDVEVEDAILSANISLSDNNCQEAIDSLIEVGHQDTNAMYLQTLASAYACKAGFNEPSFFTDDLSKIGTPTVLGGFARFATSVSMEEPDDDSYENMWRAINVLLYAGGIESTKNPTATRRSEKFSIIEAADINAQLFWMVMAQMGKFVFHYANVLNGVKGAGAETSNCFVNYSNVSLDVGVDLTTYLGTLTGPCTIINDGSFDMGLQGSLNITRLCEGAVLFNNFLSLYTEIVASLSGDDLTALTASKASIDLLTVALVAAKAGAMMDDLLDVVGVDRCVAQNTSNDDFLEVYYAFIYEGLTD